MTVRLVWRKVVAAVAMAVASLPAALAEGAEFTGNLAEDLAAVPAPPPEEPPPLPFHSIEGVGGGAITSIAYLVNPGPEGCFWGKPAVSVTYVNLNDKNLDVIAVTETIAGCIELGYAANRLGLGTLPGDIQGATSVDIDRDDVWLRNLRQPGQ
jgi:hypothetical protein